MATPSEIDPADTFRGLPLSPEQDATVRHYIKQQLQQGAPAETPELEAMLGDMLEPPRVDEDGADAYTDEAQAAAESAAACIDEGMEPIEAVEELHAAMEFEAMKHN